MPVKPPAGRNWSAWGGSVPCPEVRASGLSMEALVQPASDKGACPPGRQKLLTSADQKERLSLVYVEALAARAEFSTSEPSTGTALICAFKQVDGLPSS
ncbi:MAG: hypothetical protein F4218_00400 [Synechococcus sp. SB0677_bin_5]|nr:hypothetical protein [Synechococcus sp. SB0677_bin_5]